ISKKTAQFVAKHSSRELFNATLVRITKEKWVAETEEGERPIDKNDFSYKKNQTKFFFDKVFIAIHGTPGEDGKIQAYFDMLDIPYTTGDVLNTALTFNKYFTNQLLQKWEINTTNPTILDKNKKYNKEAIIKETGLPCFIKPNSGGSSLGNSKVNKSDEFETATQKAFDIDDQILIEPYINGTELACGVFEYNRKTTPLPPIEIVSKNDFFDYNAKYLDKATDEILPARIPKESEQKCMELCKMIYEKMNCKGMCRIDVFLKHEKMYVIEINTVPGLSEMSLLPQELEYAGYSFEEFVASVLGV
ncbi:MAG: D-alanine--D-alanine ligase, partial [Flavobacteriales bacterium]